MLGGECGLDFGDDAFAENPELLDTAQLRLGFEQHARQSVGMVLEVIEIAQQFGEAEAAVGLDAERCVGCAFEHETDRVVRRSGLQAGLDDVNASHGLPRRI